MPHTDSVTVRRVGKNEAASRVEALADVLIDCVEGGASVGFMLPITRKTAVEFWIKISNGVMNGERVLLVAEDSNGQIVGTVQLIVAQPQNQPHRADIAKMLVHRRVRRSGVGQRLMAEVERVAREEKKSVLVLDTVTGDDAERPSIASNCDKPNPGNRRKNYRNGAVRPVPAKGSTRRVYVPRAERFAQLRFHP
jgi:GNAT superfamily N-acetyltransferase